MLTRTTSYYHFKSTAALLALSVSGLLSGCANPTKSSSMYYSDLNAQNTIESISPEHPTRYLKQQNAYLSAFAGCEINIDNTCLSNNTDVPWTETTHSAINYYDSLCYNYLAYVYSRKKWSDEIDRNFNKLEQPFKSIAATLVTPIRAIQIVASAFGVSSAVFNVSDESMILSQDFITTMQIVRGVQVKFKEKRLYSVKDRFTAVAAIRDYAMICSPMGIEYELSIVQKKAISEELSPKSLGEK